MTLEQLEAFYTTEYPKLVKFLVILDAEIGKAEDAAQEAMADFVQRCMTVKPDLWLCTGSGGTDICSGFVGRMHTLPVWMTPPTATRWRTRTRWTLWPAWRTTGH